MGQWYYHYMESFFLEKWTYLLKMTFILCHINIIHIWSFQDNTHLHILIFQNAVSCLFTMRLGLSSLVSTTFLVQVSPTMHKYSAMQMSYTKMVESEMHPTLSQEVYIMPLCFWERPAIVSVSLTRNPRRILTLKKKTTKNSYHTIADLS